MSSDDDYPPLPSDSSDSIGVLNTYSKRPSDSKLKANHIPSKPTRNNSTPTPAAQDATELDWVRDYTPTGDSSLDQKEALLASLDEDEDDDDSIVDLVSQNPPAPHLGSTPDPGASTTASKKQPQPPALKRARVTTKPQSTLPLVVAPKLDESLVLLQGADDNLDLSGDVGAVGRVKVDNSELFLDIKGVIYKTATIPCNTMCVVAVGDDEARVTAVLDETVTLTCERNLFASDEVMVKGELDETMDEKRLSPTSDDDDGKGTVPAPVQKSKKKT